MQKPTRLQTEHAALIVIDMQSRLTPAIAGQNELIERALFVVKTANMLDLPIAVTEHYPVGLGSTLPNLRKAAGNATLFEKIHFDACKSKVGLLDYLERIQCKQAIVIGCEAHVCVMQTALGLLQNSLSVAIVIDAIGSRFENDKQVAIARLEQAGVIPITAEMLAFEWLERGDHPAFKDLLTNIRDR